MGGGLDTYSSLCQSLSWPWLPPSSNYSQWVNFFSMKFFFKVFNEFCQGFQGVFLARFSRGFFWQGFQGVLSRVSRRFFGKVFKASRQLVTTFSGKFIFFCPICYIIKSYQSNNFICLYLLHVNLFEICSRILTRIEHLWEQELFSIWTLALMVFSVCICLVIHA